MPKQQCFKQNLLSIFGAHWPYVQGIGTSFGHASDERDAEE